MSIAIAILGSNCGIVASDSREIDNRGNVTQNDFDKTFYLFGERVAIAHVGLMTYNGNNSKISDLIISFFNEQDTPKLLTDVIEKIKTHLGQWLKANADRINALDRNIKMVVVGKGNITSGGYKIHGIDFIETLGNIGEYDISSRIFTTDVFGCYALTGDDSAKAAIKSKLVKHRTYTNFNKTNLSNFAGRLIDFGIDNSGYISEESDTIACGGNAKIKIV